jgi:hypothetical protein
MNHDIDRTQVGFAQEGEGSVPHPGGSVFHEDQHMNLAARLMDVNSEEEFEYFLGDVISGAADAVGKFINSPTGQALGSGLKDVAKQVLPVAGQALGTRFGGAPGGQIGQALGTAVAGALGDTELEELEWEAANNFVRLAGEAAKNAAEAPPGGDPHAVAKNAIIEAAKIHAPGLVSSLTGGGPGMGQPGCHHYGGGHHHSGRWYRHGKRIILVGV